MPRDLSDALRQEKGRYLLLAVQLWASRPPVLKSRLFPGRQVWFMVGELGLKLHPAVERTQVLREGGMLH